MRVVINAWAAMFTKTGIGHYTSELIRCLGPQLGGDEIVLFPEGRAGILTKAWRQVRRWLFPGAKPGDGSWRAKLLQSVHHVKQHVLARQLAALCRRMPIDVYHETNFIPLASDLPTVATIHDLSIINHPEWHPADRVVYFERFFHQRLPQCAHVLAISEFGRQEIIRTLGFRPEQVTRTYMGIRPGMAPIEHRQARSILAPLNLPDDYLLYLGTLEPRKNILLLLRAYCSLPAAIRERSPLVLAGGWGWNYAEIARYFESEARHKHVLHLGYVDEERIPALYSAARALVFPTLYEGFGLPPVEMLACGGAVIASTAGAVAETVGGQAHLIDPHDEAGWRAALLRIITDDNWRDELRRGAVAVARPYTWEQCAADTLRVYRQLARGGARRAA